MFINRYLRDKSHEPKIPLSSNKSPSVNNDLAKKSFISSSFTTNENNSDTSSLIDNIVRSSQEKVDDSKVTIEKKMLAQVVCDHFKFYDILHKMLPPKAVNELNRGEQVMPEEFESVTIFFSDIVGYTEITSKVDPLLVVTLLNQLYSVMDYCASFFNIFKVETIGDAYMIVGGMNNDDDNHATNIADFALLVMKACELVRSPYDGSPIQLRVGIHSGPVAAGVVGTVMPRFCLFGNAVNVAHRMESNSEVAKIQCSKCTTNILEKKGTHNLEKRGMVDCKGLGRIEAYWICSMTEEHMQSLPFTYEEVLETCREILDSSFDMRYPHLKENNTTIVNNDPVYHERSYSNDRVISGIEKLEGENIDDPTMGLMKYSCSIPQLNSNSLQASNTSNESIDAIDHQKPLSFINADIIHNSGLIQSTTSVLNTLIICDQPCIRLSTMHLLKETFKVENYFSVAIDIYDAMNVLENHTRFDIIVIEKNLYMTLDDGGKEMLRSLVDRRRRLLIMIELDCDYPVEEEVIESWYHSLAYPFPSPTQLRSEFESSDDSYANMLSKLDEPKVPQSTQKNFNIMICCSSKSASKLIKKQLSLAISDMDTEASIDEFPSALKALESSCIGKPKSPYDIIIIDNALKLDDIQATELLEFLRNQPSSKNSLMITLTKSVITATSTLVDAGADVIWSRPLPEKEALKERIKRLCKHKF